MWLQGKRETRQVIKYRDQSQLYWHLLYFQFSTGTGGELVGRVPEAGGRGGQGVGGARQSWHRGMIGSSWLLLLYFLFSKSSFYQQQQQKRQVDEEIFVPLFRFTHIYYFSLLYQRGTGSGEGAVCRREQEVMTFIIMIIMNILQQQGAAARDQGGDAQENVRPSWELEQVRH